MPYKDFQALTVLTADDVDTYLMNQAVMTFADATARDAALPIPTEGMHCFLLDTDTLQYYDGSAWQSSVPAVTVVANLEGGIASQIPYQSAADTTAFITNGTSGQYLQSNGTSAPAFASINVNEVSQSVVDKSAAYTLTATEANKTIRFTQAGDVDLTIPDVLAVGEFVNVIQFGTGQVTLVASSITLNAFDGNLKTDGQYAVATVFCVASGVYVATGRLGA